MQGNVIVVSGISGAGKSTLSNGIKNYATGLGEKVVLLDGDMVRTFYEGELGYEPHHRLLVSMNLAFAAKLLSDQGIHVTLATMLSQEGAREFLARKVHFLEIHLQCSIEECVKNDIKQVYKENLSLNNPNLVGHDLNFHAPKNPDLLIHTHVEPPDESLRRILHFLNEKKIFRNSQDPLSETNIFQKMAVFLDRDGTINRSYTEGPVYDIDKFELLPGAGTAIRSLNNLGLRTIVATNQGGIRHKDRDFDWERYRSIERRLIADLQEPSGAVLNEILVCPHADYEGCACRKPEIGMFLKARDQFHLDLSHCFMVGDSARDIVAGKRAGMQTILVLTGWGVKAQEELKESSTVPDVVAKDLSEASQHIQTRFLRQLLKK